MRSRSARLPSPWHSVRLLPQTLKLRPVSCSTGPNLSETIGHATWLQTASGNPRIPLPVLPSKFNPPKSYVPPRKILQILFRPPWQEGQWPPTILISAWATSLRAVRRIRRKGLGEPCSQGFGFGRMGGYSYCHNCDFLDLGHTCTVSVFLEQEGCIIFI